MAERLNTLLCPICPTADLRPALRSLAPLPRWVCDVIGSRIRLQDEGRSGGNTHSELVRFPPLRGQGRGASCDMSRISYRGLPPPDTIQRAVWLYFRFTLSFRNVRICSQNG